jgi:hypothetical protein
MKRLLLALGLCSVLATACQLAEDLNEQGQTQEPSEQALPNDSEFIGATEAQATSSIGAAPSALSNTCRTVCTYNNCGPCVFAGEPESCYIYNGCGGRYPIP